MANELTAARLREILNYCPETGVWTWIKTENFRLKPGSIAGRTDRDGYREISIGKRHYRSGRLAFLYMLGEWPPRDMHVDHIDHCPSNDRWTNLRLATQSQNQANTRRRTSSGLKGVKFRDGKWLATISVNNKKKHLGSFINPSDAHAAYVAAGRELHGEFFFPGENLQAA
jgi:hypothetical protein